MDESRQLYVKTRKAWREWLRKHHRKESVVWFVFYKKHTGKPTVTYDEAVEEALCFGWIDSTKRRLDDERYVHQFTPRKKGSCWSKLNRDRAERMIKQRKMAKAGLEQIELARASGEWEKLSGSYVEPEMIDAFQQALDNNRKARTHFE
ncbi:MAG: hypothetical protein AAF492_12720, partial [Verrucomicrobiota bacterium]